MQSVVRCCYRPVVRAQFKSAYSKPFDWMFPARVAIQSSTEGILSGRAVLSSASIKQAMAGLIHQVRFMRSVGDDWMCVKRVHLVIYATVARS
jgi:hypothetical protein